MYVEKQIQCVLIIKLMGLIDNHVWARYMYIDNMVW